MLNFGRAMDNYAKFNPETLYNHTEVVGTRQAFAKLFHGEDPIIP